MTSLQQQYLTADQAQVYKFFPQLSAEQQKDLENQLLQLDPAEVNEIVEKANNFHEPESQIEPLPESVYASVSDTTESELQKWRDLGLEQISAGKVAVLLLAGGQGTRLGSSAPKGCYNIGLPSKKSLFQLQAERIAKLMRLAAAKNGGSVPDIPWYIMTSGPTRGPTETFFKEANFFGLPEKNVVFFEQGVLPCITTDGKIILESEAKVAVAPDGNGGVYKALEKSGVLADMKKREIEHVHMYCVDNSLVKVADPTFIGFAATNKCDVATKVVRKRDATESVGLIVTKNNAPGVIEYSEISAELAAAKDDLKPELLKLRAANIVNHYYSADFLYRSPEMAKQLPFHIAHKKIPYAGEDGKTVKPTSNNGIKLEQFVFDIFPQVPLDKFACLEVPRQSEFSPVKNAPGTGQDCPETARDDLMAEGQSWLNKAGINSGLVEISPLVSYDGEGLEKYADLDANIKYIER